MGRDRTAPSLAARIAAAWLRATRGAGCALTSREVRARWADVGDGGPLPHAFGTYVSSLAAAGVLVRVGGGPAAGRYKHADALDVADEPVRSRADQVLAALRAACAVAGAAVNAERVIAAARTLGCTLHANMIRRELAGLASADGADAAPVRRTTVRSASGKAFHWWQPAGSAYAAPDPEGPVSHRDAAVRGVERVRAALGRPPSLREVQLWHGAQRAVAPDDPVVRQLTARSLAAGLRLARGPRNAALARGERAAGKLSLTPVSGPLTCRGGAPWRFAVAPVSEAERRVCAADDLLRVLRPADEEAGIAELRRWPGAPVEVRETLAMRREAILRSSLLRFAPEAEWATLVGRIEHATDALDRWACERGTPPGGLTRTQRPDGERRREAVATVRRLLTGEAAGKAAARTVGDTAGASDADLAPYQSEVQAVLGRTGAGLDPVFIPARRLPTSATGRGLRLANGRGRGDVTVVLDRVDALAIAVEVAGGPVARTLVADALTLLGQVVRDDREVLAWLGWLPAGVPAARRGLVVALGLLGHSLSADGGAGAGLRPDDPHDMAAHLLATVLSGAGDVDGAARQIAARAAGAARGVALHAVSEIAGGTRIAVVG